MKKILIIEDQIEVRKMLVIALRRRTHITLEAATGLGALELAKLHKPLVVLLDAQLSGSPDGLQVCEWIKGEPPMVSRPCGLSSLAPARVACPPGDQHQPVPAARGLAPLSHRRTGAA